MKVLKKFMLVMLVVLVAFGLTACGGSSEKDVIKVAIVKQLDHASLDEIAKAIGDQLDSIAKNDKVEIEYEIFSGQGEQSTLKQIGDQCISEDYDVIIPVATLAAQVMTTCAQKTKTPIVYAAISDPEAAELTGIDYVTGTSDALNTESIYKMMIAQNPNLKKVGLLYSLSEKNSEKPIKEMKELLSKKGIEAVVANGNTNDEIITASKVLVSEKVEAIFTPTDNIVMATELSIADTFASAKIPHYTGADSFVRNGAYTTCGVNYTELGKKTADLAYEAVTKGMDNMEDYYLMDGGIVTVNTETAKKLGYDYSVFKDIGEIVEVETSKE